MKGVLKKKMPQKPTIHFAHATGLPAESYILLFEEFKAVGYTVNYLSCAGIGKFKPGRNWKNLVDEQIDFIERNYTSPVIGIGHSLGAVLSLAAAIKRPDLYEKLVIIDPPYFARKKRFFSFLAYELGIIGKVLPIAKKAANRRSEFSSKEEAFQYFKPKRLFRFFPEESLRAYVEHGLIPTADKKGFTLKISKKIEYQLFCSTPYKLPYKADLKVNGLFLYAANHELLQKDDLKEIFDSFPSLIPKGMAGTHLFPLERPKEVANEIISFLSTSSSQFNG